MTIEFNIFSILLYISAIATGLLSWLLFGKAGKAGCYFSLMMLVLSVWALAYGLELGSHTLEWMLFWVRIEYIGVGLIPGFWAAFTIAYTGRDEWLTNRTLAIIFTFPIITILIVWTNSWHHLHYSETSVSMDGPFPLLAFTRGLWYWLHTAYFYLTLLLGTWLLLRNYQRAAPLFKRQTLMVLAGAMVPWFVNLMYLLGYRPFGYIDLTPVVFSVTGVIIGWALLQFKLFDIVPLARDKVIEGMSEGVMVLNQDNRIIDVNPSMKRLLNEITTIPVGKEITTLFSGYDLLNTMIHNRINSVVEFKHRCGELEIFLEVNATPLFKKDGSHNGLLLVWRDITQQKKIQEELIKSKLKSEESDRLKTSFLANMSHEIRNPLNAIIGFTELLRETNLPEHERTDYVGIIERSAHHLLELINDIIDISKIEAGLEIVRSEELSVNSLLGDLEAFFKPEAAGKNIKFIVEKSISDQDDKITTDSRKLKQILINLIGNALKFTNKGHVKIRASRNKSLFQFDVSDTGIGINKNDLKIVFDRFRRSDSNDAEKRKGTGLGLSISKGYAELLKGSLKLTSEPGVGSTFTLLIPEIAADYKETGKIAARKSDLPDWNGKTILIAEDEPVNILYVQLTLKHTGAELLTAGNGIEAIEWVKKRPDIDLIIMDIKMPEMDGIQATQHIRKLHPELPILALSGHALLQGDELKKVGFSAMISKPVRKQLLLDSIDEYIKRS